ncbi:MAG: hypothetical protein SGPRY_013290, partial [Prymnesium sp.]
YVHDTSPSIFSRFQVCVLHKLNVGSRTPSTTPLRLAESISPFVNNLRVTSRLPSVQTEGVKPMSSTNGAIVVGTIRMGFGHHRIAYAATSWALGYNKPTYFHDLLNIDSPEATLIKDMDKNYSWMAHHLQPLLLGLPKDTPIITSHCFVGLTAVSLGFTKVINLVIDNHAQWFIVVPGAYNLVQGPTNYHNLMRMGVPSDRLVLAGAWIPKELVDNIDSDCNRRIDRAEARAARRLLIPVGGAGPFNLLQCSLPRSLLPLSFPRLSPSLGSLSHYLPPRPYAARPRFPPRHAAWKRARVDVMRTLPPTGAQKKFVTSFVAALKPHVLSGKVELMLNAGDHEHMRIAFLQAIKVIGVSYDVVDSIEGVHKFCDNARAGKLSNSSITLFTFKEPPRRNSLCFPLALVHHRHDYFPAVATTDLLSRVADALCCKPSELAFYPVPKLMIRRVGDHEAYSAIRASELGDGEYLYLNPHPNWTLELRELSDALAYIQLMIEGPQLLIQMNDCIKANNKARCEKIQLLCGGCAIYDAPNLSQSHPL